MHVWRVWMVEVRAVEVGAVAVRVVAVRAVAVSSAGTLQPPREAHRQSCLPLPCVLPSCDVHVHVHAPSRKTHTQRSRGDTPWEAQTSRCDVSCEGAHPKLPKEESSHLRTFYNFLESQVRPVVAVPRMPHAQTATPSQSTKDGSAPLGQHKY